MQGYFLGGCVTTHSDTFPAGSTTGRVQAVGLCLGSNYDVHIRARIGASWGPWSPNLNQTI